MTTYEMGACLIIEAGGETTQKFTVLPVTPVLTGAATVPLQDANGVQLNDASGN